MEVESRRIAAIDVGVPRKDCYVARRVIHADAQHRKAAGGDFALAELDVKLAGACLQFKISQAAFHHNFSTASFALLAQHAESERTVRRKAGHAAVFKLNLRSSIVGGGHLGPLEQGGIGDCRVGEYLAALRNLHLSLDKGKPHRPRRGTGIFSRHNRRKQGRPHGKCRRTQQPGDQASPTH